MSIKSIDTQIMITRAADLARDASVLQRHPQTTQESIAARNITESIDNRSRVLQTTESEMENIRTDEEGGGAGASGGSAGSEEEEEEMTEEQRKELLVAPAAYDQIIDIMI